MSNETKIIRKREGCLEDKDSGTVYVGSDTRETSIVIAESNVSVTPSGGGNFQCASGGIQDICGATTDPWLASVPQMPSKNISQKTFPFTNYIVPIITIGMSAMMLIKETEGD